jgi:hypothetical protein
VPKPDVKQKLNDIDRYTVILDYARIQRISSSSPFTQFPQFLLDREATEKDRAEFLGLLLDALRKRGYEIGSTASSSGLFEEPQKSVRFYVMEESADEGTETEKEKIIPIMPPFFMDETITGDLALELRSIVDKLALYNIQKGGVLIIPEAVMVADRMGGNPLLIFYGSAEIVSTEKQFLGRLFGPFAALPPRFRLFLYAIDPKSGELIWADGEGVLENVSNSNFRKTMDILLDKLPDKGAKPK